MDTNGGGQRRVTGAAGYEMSPAASLDGRHLVFAGDRTSRGLDILSLDLLEPGHERVLAARRGHDNMPAFSPDGSHIVFIATSDGNAEIYMMKADGTGLVRITHTVEDETSPQFAGGGRQIIFSRKNGDKLALYQSEVR
jgi:TolB protein